jgi:hypothetical protein
MRPRVSNLIAVVRALFPPGTPGHPAPAYPPESLTVDQIRYGLSQWLLARRLGRRAARIILHDAAVLIGYHRHHNAVARISHTKTTKRKLSKTGIDVDRIRSCLDSNFALYC